MGSLTEFITRLSPLSILVDRARDGTLSDTVRDLEPHAVFRTTESYQRLSRRILARYDMVVCCGHGTRAYSRAERAAVRAFVEEGGTLVVAASAGEFEACSGKSISMLALNGLAGEFGFEFLSAADFPLDHRYGYRHIRRRELELTATGRRVGLLKAETFLWFPAPIRTPQNATALLRVRSSGAPVFARARVGRGLVVVYGDIALFANGWSGFPAALHLAHLAPRGRRQLCDRPPAVLDVLREEISGGRTTVRASPFVQYRSERVLELTQAAWAELHRALRFPKPPRRVLIRLEPGIGLRATGGEAGEIACIMGADLDDAQVVAKLVNLLCIRGLRAWWSARADWPFAIAAANALVVRVLRRLGFGGAADREEEMLRAGPDADVATVYSETVHPPQGMKRFFIELQDDLGDDLLLRLSKAMPKKDPFKSFPRAPFTALDHFTFYLARAFGEEAWNRVEARGHTVRRLGLEKPGSDEFKAGVDRAVRKILRDPAEPASARLAAARHLAGRLKEDRALLTRSRGRDFVRALPAALALAVRRDPRTREPLVRFGQAQDDGVARIAALLAVLELGDRSLADRLVALANGADTAFMLAAGQALLSVGDPRARRFSFAERPGCTYRKWENGTLRRYALVDGREVAIVTTGPTWWARGHGGATSTCYVFWVHTTGAFRRLGIAHETFRAALETRWPRTCSTTLLHSMGDYFIHALYQDHGLLDSHGYVEFDKTVESPVGRAPRGVRIREGRLRDAVALAELSDRVHAEGDHPPLEVPDFPGRGVARVAEEKGHLVGAAWFTGSRLFAFVVDDKIEAAPRREAVGIALLRSAERELRRRGVKKLRGYSWLRYGDDFHTRCLHLTGYAGKRDNLREQTRIRDLGLFLSEMQQTLSARVAGMKPPPPRTTIAIRGGRLVAGLAIQPGGVEVRPGLPAKADIRIEGNEEAVQRMVLAISSPLEEYIQTAIKVKPPLNGEVKRLLALLFPRTSD